MQRPILLIGLIGLMSSPAQAADMLPPSIIHEACTQYLKGAPFDIIARFEDESQLFDPKVMYRARGDSHWKAAPFVKDAGVENFRATITAKDLKGTLQYFIEVFDEFGNGPARMGSPEAPITVEPSKAPESCNQVPTITKPRGVTSGSGPAVSLEPIPPKSTAATGIGTATSLMMHPLVPPVTRSCEQADRPLYCEAWLWGIVGGLAIVGGGVGLYLFLRPKEAAPTVRGSVKIVVSGPNPTVEP